MQQVGYFFICFWLFWLCLHTRDLVQAIDRNTQAVRALRVQP